VERAREYRYRFGQSVVFGLPVVALQIWGPALGARDAPRWAGVLQALLSGWVLHVGAGGMLFEGLVLLHARRRGTGGLVVATVAVALYVFSAIQLGRLIFTDAAGARPAFHAVVVLIAAWSAWQWWRLARRSRAMSAERTSGSAPPAAEAPANHP
jgi:hypothetical protein